MAVFFSSTVGGNSFHLFLISDNTIRLNYFGVKYTAILSRAYNVQYIQFNLTKLLKYTFKLPPDTHTYVCNSRGKKC